jgi:hypothetical protein
MHEITCGNGAGLKKIRAFSLKYWSIAGCLAVMEMSCKACDLCSIYSAPPAHNQFGSVESAEEARGQVGKGFFGGLAEQFTYFGTLQLDGQVQPNPVGQYLNSSISQVFVGYNFADRFGIQLNLPIIYRSFLRPEGFAIDKGTEAGIGDLALLGHAVLVNHASENGNITLSLMGGVKFPTGSTQRLQEEFNEIELPGAPESGIHGHDLTLGSGSYDGIVGTSIFTRWHRGFMAAQVHYSIRSTGDYDYRFANDLMWSGGPGMFLLLKQTCTLALQFNVSGEYKGLDTFQGASAADTGTTSVFLGPQFLFTWTDKLSAQVGVDIPVSIDNTALQLVPDYRVRAAFTWRF